MDLKRAYSTAGVYLKEGTDNFTARELLTDFVPTSLEQAVFYKVGKNSVTGFIFFAGNAYAEPDAAHQMGYYDTLASKISSRLGESRTVIHSEKKPETRMKDLVAGKAQYRTEWNYDNYSLLLMLGGEGLDKDARDAVFLYVVSVPEWVQN